MKIISTFTIIFASLLLIFAISSNVLAQTVAPTTTPLGAPLIIADLSDADSFVAASPYDSARPASYNATFIQAVTNFVKNGLTATSVSFATPNFIDTQGNFLTGILGVQNAFADPNQYKNAPPPFVVISDTATATLEILVTLRQKLGSDSTVPIFTTSTTNELIVNDSPNVFRINGDDMSIASNFVDMLFAMGQNAVCLITDQDLDGAIFGRSIMADLASRPKGYPILLNTIQVKSGSRGFGTSTIAASDDAAILAVAAGANPCSAVIVAGEGNIAARILSARKRAASNANFGSAAVTALSRVFFFFSPSATARFPNTNAYGLTYQGLLTVANYQTNSQLVGTASLGLTAASVNGLTDTFAISLSPVLDAISLCALAASASSTPANFLASIPAITLSTGATTPFQLSAATRARARSDCRQRLVILGSASGASTSVATSVVATWTAPAQVVVALPNTVPAQIAQPFTVCLVGQQSCPTLGSLNHAYFTLLTTAPNVLSASTSIFVKAISAGQSGITTIASVAKAMTSCDFVIGPGNSATARNLYPYFNYLNVPMIDFGSTDASLGDQIGYFSYARINPTDEYMARVAGSTFQNFGWPSVAIVTSLDSYGSQIVSSYTAGLARMKVAVEATIMLPSNMLNDNATVYDALSKVQNQLITRIVILAISSTDDANAIFFRNIVDLGMPSTQIFWLSDSLCQYAAQNPSARAALQNSMCASPAFDANAFRQSYMNLLNADGTLATNLFASGGFNTAACDLKTSGMYAPFASDAALTVLNVIRRLSDDMGGNKAKMVATQKNVTRMMNYIRSTHVTGITGIVAFDALTGERTNAAYTVDMMQPGGVSVVFANWNSGTGFASVDLVTPLMWFGNNTDLPKYTTRDIRFIVLTTVANNTASVVFSILGFIMTVIVFVFLYKHYKLKKMVEQHEQAQQQHQKQGEGSASVDMNQIHPSSQQQQQQQQQQGNGQQYVNSDLRQQGW